MVSESCSVSVADFEMPVDTALHYAGKLKSPDSCF